MAFVFIAFLLMFAYVAYDFFRKKNKKETLLHKNFVGIRDGLKIYFYVFVFCLLGSCAILSLGVFLSGMTLSEIFQEVL